MLWLLLLMRNGTSPVLNVVFLQLAKQDLVLVVQFYLLPIISIVSKKKKDIRAS